jgi:hypothetical protein
VSCHNRINLVKIATSLANQRTLWEPLVSYDPVARYYVRLAREHEFEARLLTWLPGQGTDWWRERCAPLVRGISMRSRIVESGQR